MPKMKIDPDGCLNYFTKNYWNLLTKTEKEGHPYEWYLQSDAHKRSSYQLKDYYDECMEARRLKRNAYRRDYRIRKKEQAQMAEEGLV